MFGLQIGLTNLIHYTYITESLITSRFMCVFAGPAPAATVTPNALLTDDVMVNSSFGINSLVSVTGFENIANDTIGVMP